MCFSITFSTENVKTLRRLKSICFRWRHVFGKKSVQLDRWPWQTRWRNAPNSVGDIIRKSCAKIFFRGLTSHSWGVTVECEVKFSEIRSTVDRFGPTLHFSWIKQHFQWSQLSQKRKKLLGKISSSLQIHQFYVAATNKIW